ncbi:hypothetical protein AJ78_08808 [Emergomyces pasteurianus Ep9510]|uniref:Uncharacterized protein n=1 Tax=Emergomyces pasteurianus Ep9510 TaxID=1447872 RepID=A0A1J9P2C9_9EURO|nr:hypothetical protein AJ78_08808 [Emergomyces pasteurianus Ep9510]
MTTSSDRNLAKNQKQCGLSKAKKLLQSPCQNGFCPSCAASTLPHSPVAVMPAREQVAIGKDTTAVQQIRAELNKRRPLEPFTPINKLLSYGKLCSIRQGIQRAESSIQDPFQPVDATHHAGLLQDIKILYSYTATLESAIVSESKKRMAPPHLGGQERNAKRQRLP